MTKNVRILWYVSKYKRLMFVRDRRVIFTLFSTGFLLLSVHVGQHSYHFTSLSDSRKPVKMPQLVLITYSGIFWPLNNIFIGSIGTPWPCPFLATAGTTHHIYLCHVLQNDLVYKQDVFWGYFVFLFLMEYTESNTSNTQWWLWIMLNSQWWLWIMSNTQPLLWIMSNTQP